eukprot:s1301_g9.t1
MRWSKAAWVAALVAGGSAAAVILIIFLAQSEPEEAGGETSEPPAEREKAASDEEKKEGRKANLLLRKRVSNLLAGAITPAELPGRIAAAVEEIRSGSSEELEEKAFGLVSADLTQRHSRGLLGCGGFAKVELVEHQDSEFRAWKIMSKAVVHKAGMMSNALTERLILAATSLCQSPFIIGYYGCCQTASYLLFQLEHGSGGELYSVYKRENLFGSEEHARYYMACASAAISHLHELRVVLRSLKPEDCVLTAQGRLKLIDFGLSKFIVHKTYTTCGTPDYFPPEIISSAGHDFDVDWWGVGVMTFELLAGNPPFEAAYPIQIYKNVLQGIGKVTFPKSMTPAAKSLIQQLCGQVPRKRLPDGPGALEDHDFFAPLGPWTGLKAKTPPFKPSCETGPLANFSPNEEDVAECFRSKSEAPPLPEWQLFGPEGPSDEFSKAG